MFWLSYTREGEFLGAAIINAATLGLADQKAQCTGVAPGVDWECESFEIMDGEWIPSEFIDRMMSEEDTTRLAKLYKYKADNNTDWCDGKGEER